MRLPLVGISPYSRGFLGYIVMLRARMFHSLIPVLISWSDQRTEHSCAQHNDIIDFCFLLGVEDTYGETGQSVGVSLRLDVLAYLPLIFQAIGTSVFLEVRFWTNYDNVEILCQI